MVAVYDLDEERSLIAMELCEGGTLRDRLRRGPLSPSDALRRATELATTLCAVHAAGIVHRDLKPGNLLLRSLAAGAASLAVEGQDLVLGDFGLALLDERRGDGDGDAVRAGGTLSYMAPEQQRGVATSASDVFALGVLLRELLCGPASREAKGAVPLLVAAAHEATLPTALAPLLGAARAPVEELLGALLDPDPGSRPTARDLIPLLDDLRHRLPTP